MFDSAGSRLAEAKAPVRKMQLFRRIQLKEQPTGKRGTAFSARTQKDPCHEVTPTTNCHRAYSAEVTLSRQVAVHEHAGRVTPSQQSIEKPPACRIGAQKPGGRSLTTPKLRSSASPALTIVPSSNNRPISVTPWGTRRGGEKVGRGCSGSGAQSLRASETSTKPARRVSDGCPVLFEITSISSRSDGTRSRSTPAKTRAISCATLRRKRSVWTKSTAERNRDWRKTLGHASGTCAFNSSSL